MPQVESTVINGSRIPDATPLPSVLVLELLIFCICVCVHVWIFPTTPSSLTSSVLPVVFCWLYVDNRPAATFLYCIFIFVFVFVFATFLDCIFVFVFDAKTKVHRP